MCFEQASLVVFGSDDQAVLRDERDGTSNIKITHIKQHIKLAQILQQYAFTEMHYGQIETFVIELVILETVDNELDVTLDHDDIRELEP